MCADVEGLDRDVSAEAEVAVLGSDRVLGLLGHSLLLFGKWLNGRKPARRSPPAPVAICRAQASFTTGPSSTPSTSNFTGSW